MTTIEIFSSTGIVIYRFLGDVGRVATPDVGVAVKEVDLETEAASKLSEAIGTMIRSREEKENFD